MAKETPGPARGQYGEVVTKLQAIVEALEKGELSLEESLDRFTEGIQLVKRGEALLAEAEKRVEQLLSEDGRAAALKVPEDGPGAAVATPMATKAVRRVSPPGGGPQQPPDDEDDVPF